MKFPKEMIIKLITGDKLHIDLLNQKFDKNIGVFEVTIKISKELVNAKTKDDCIKFITENK